MEGLKFSRMQPATFLELNRKKLRFAFLFTSITFLALVLIVLAIAWFNGAAPSARLVTIILLVAGLAFPAFTLCLGWIGWHYKRRKRNKTFARPPFDELNRIGFRRVTVNEHSKWVFTEEAWQGEVDGFTIQCDVVKERYHIIEVEAFCQHQQISKADFATLSERFKQYDIEFGFGSINKQYDTRRLDIHTIQELNGELKFFARLLKQEGFEPANRTT